MIALYWNMIDECLGNTQWRIRRYEFGGELLNPYRGWVELGLPRVVNEAAIRARTRWTRTG